jgi:hypothetical protein
MNPQQKIYFFSKEPKKPIANKIRRELASAAGDNVSVLENEEYFTACNSHIKLLVVDLTSGFRLGETIEFMDYNRATPIIFMANGVNLITFRELCPNYESDVRVFDCALEIRELKQAVKEILGSQAAADASQLQPEQPQHRARRAASGARNR